MSTTPPPDETPADPPAAADAPASGAPEPTGPGRRWLLRRPQHAPPAAEPTASETQAAEADAAEADAPEVVPTPARPPRAGSLRRERRRLISRREEAVYNLGGLAFELYRRDLLPEGAMRMRAGDVAHIDDTVRDIDVRLGDMERARRERRSRAPADPAVGCCLACRTTFQAQARFCWQCGNQVVPPPVGGDDQPTGVIAFQGET